MAGFAFLKEYPKRFGGTVKVFYQIGAPGTTWEGWVFIADRENSSLESAKAWNPVLNRWEYNENRIIPAEVEELVKSDLKLFETWSSNHDASMELSRALGDNPFYWTTEVMWPNCLRVAKERGYQYPIVVAKMVMMMWKKY